MIDLPDCSEYTDDVVSDDLLDAVDPGRLVRALAEAGAEGARAVLRSTAAEDAELQRALTHLRERLRRQAERDVRRSLGEYDQTLSELAIAERRSQEEIDRAMAELEEKLEQARARGRGAFTMPDLVSEVTAALLVPDASWNRPPPPPSIWQRIKAWFVHLWARLFHRRGTGGAPARLERRVPIATLALDGRTLGPSALGDALARLSPKEEGELTERVGEQIRANESDLRRAAEAKRREAEAQRRRLEAERTAAEERGRGAIDRAVREQEDRRIDRELRERGYVIEGAHGLEVTFGLVERFARLLLEDAERNTPTDVRFALRGGAATGVYEKARLRQSDEIARLDVPSSILAARMVGQRHLDESTSYIYREATSESVHVVLAFDRSGSMAEAGKLAAAKKALLALYVAIHRKYPTATIDVLAFDNTVHVMDLVELWECEPGAFTNTAEALRSAHRLLESSKASRREFFLVTDGLPEAYTDTEGRVRAGQLDLAMEQALTRARELRKVHPLKFSMVLLRSPHPEYELAAREIARTAGGELVVTDPARLGVELLVRWAQSGEAVERAVSAPATASPARPEVGPSGARRKRRADRRMGG